MQVPVYSNGSYCFHPWLSRTLRLASTSAAACADASLSEPQGGIVGIGKPLPGIFPSRSRAPLPVLIERRLCRLLRPSGLSGQCKNRTSYATSASVRPP
jgi:hypothetical protein